MTPYDLPFPQMGVSNAPQDQLRDACCHLANMIEDIDKAPVCYVGCHYEPSDVAFCQITLAFVFMFHSLLW